MTEEKLHVAVIGGGLVGAINACFFAKRGFKVDIYEGRQDIRHQDVVRGRSINLAVSRRARDALKHVGLEDLVVSEGIKMHARMIHGLDGKRRPIPYGKPDQYIMSVDRRRLNEVLLDAAEKFPGVKIHDNHKLASCNFETGQCTFETPGGKVVGQFDLIVGNDGAYSAVRRQMMKPQYRMDYSQEYIPHGYLELIIPAKDEQFAMEINYLHIWPRNTFMMIALPNKADSCFVVTMFMPFSIFESIKTEEQLMTFFEETFPDSIPLLGKEALIKTYFSNKALPLVLIKCSPYHIGDKAVIMGDAAHAMVPFYGQGMNCGFEDCIIFDELLDKFNNNLALALPAYTEARNADAKAICDLAMYNYIEMRESVNSKMFLLRKQIDNFLYYLMPNTWIPLYTMVSFTRTPYSQAIAKRKWQDKVLSRVVSGAAVGMAAFSGLMAVKYFLKTKDISVKQMVVGWSVFSKVCEYIGYVDDHIS